MSARRILLALVLVAVGAGFGAAIIAWQQGNWTPALKDKNPAVRVAAIRAMGWHGEANLLIEALQDDNADVRLVAAQHLGAQGPEGERRAAALVGALKDAHAGVRREAAETLCWIGPESAPALYHALTDPDPRVRAGAALALGDVGGPKQGRVRAQGEAQRVLPLLSKLLGDEDAEVRRNAADTLKVLRREAR